MPGDGGRFLRDPSRDAGARAGTALTACLDQAVGRVRRRAPLHDPSLGLQLADAGSIARHDRPARQPYVDRQWPCAREEASGTARFSRRESPRARLREGGVGPGRDAIYERDCRARIDHQQRAVGARHGNRRRIEGQPQVIDGAITESRAALQTEPDNPAAQESLFDALRSKLELLQDVVALINEMRKGNPEGAARIVSGINQ